MRCTVVLKKIFFLILFVVFNLLLGYGQRTDSYSFHLQYDGINGIYKSNILDTNGGASFDISIGRYDTLQNEQWSVLYGGAGKEHVSRSKLIRNNLYNLGYTFSQGAGVKDMLILKTTENGALNATILGESNSDEATNIIQGRSPNEHIVLGSTESGVNNQDIILATLDDQNHLLNDSVIWLDRASNESASAIRLDTSDGSILIGGKVDFLNGNEDDMLAIKLDSNDQIVWMSGFTGSGDQEVNAILVDDSKDIYWIGYSKGGVPQGIIVKTNADGTILWQKEYSTTAGNKFLRAQMRQGNVIITGVLTSVTGSQDDFMVLELDTSGAVNWSKHINYSGQEYPTQIDHSDTGYVITGPRLKSSGWSFQLEEMDIAGNSCASLDFSVTSMISTLSDTMLATNLSKTKFQEVQDTQYVSFFDPTFEASICLLKSRFVDTLGTDVYSIGTGTSSNLSFRAIEQDQKTLLIKNNVERIFPNRKFIGELQLNFIDPIGRTFLTRTYKSYNGRQIQMEFPLSDVSFISSNFIINWQWNLDSSTLHGSMRSSQLK